MSPSFFTAITKRMRKAVRGNRARNHTLPPLSVRANAVWMIVGRIVYAGCSWGTLAALTKLGSPELVGLYALGVAISTPIVVCSRFHLRTVLATDSERKNAFRDYVRLTAVSSLVAVPTVAVFLIAADYPIDVCLITLLVAGVLVLESFSELCYGLFQRCHRADRVALSIMIRSPLVLAGLLVAVYTTGNLVAALAVVGVLASMAVFGFDRGAALALLRHEAVSSTGIDQQGSAKQRLLSLLGTAAPLGFVTLILALGTSIPRYFVERCVGMSQLGLYAAMCSLIVPGNTVVTGLAQSALSKLAEHANEGRFKEFRNLVVKLAALGGILGASGLAVGWIMGGSIVSLLYTPEYAVNETLLRLVMGAAAFTYIGSVLGTAVNAMRAFRIQLPAQILMTSVIAVLSAVVIPAHGLVGAGYVLLATSAFGTLIYSCILAALVRRRTFSTP